MARVLRTGDNTAANTYLSNEASQPGGVSRLQQGKQNTERKSISPHKHRGEPPERQEVDWRWNGAGQEGFQTQRCENRVVCETRGDSYV
jgi:hypothetical protein